MSIKIPQGKMRGMTQEESKQIISQTSWAKEQYSNVGDWAKAASDLFTEMQESTTGWFSSQTQSMYTQKLKNLYDQKDNWSGRFQGNAEATNTIDAIAEDLKNAQEVIEQNGKYYSQWNSKEEYEDWNTYYGGDQATRVKNATANLEAKTKAKNDAYGQYNAYFNTSVDDIDFMTYDSEAAEAKGKELLRAFQQAQAEERKAQEILWDAKYDTMTAAQLQAVMKGLKDKAEKDHVSILQKNANLAERKQEFEHLNAPFDPESEHYDPTFLEKTFYSSTKLTDGSLGESDTGYADIDYEFINGNPEISELIVGMDRNLYQITDEEKQRYNYWHNYDKEHGTNKAKRYLYLLQETLNDRDSAEDYAKIEGKALQEILYGVKSGLARFGNDVNNWYLKPEEYIPMTSTEMTAQRAHDGLADVGDLKINGQTISQHLFNVAENVGYNLPSSVPSLLYGDYLGTATKAWSAISSGLSANGAAYREMVNQGYTPDQAKRYGKRVGVGTGAVDVASNWMEDKVKEKLKTVVSDGAAGALAKILSETEWLGLADSVRSTIQNGAFKEVTGESKPDAETLQAAKNAVTVKAMDKIFNRIGATPEEISLDLRRSLMGTLKDPETREAIVKSGAFTHEKLDEIAVGLALAGDKDDAVGTYVGDVVYGENGFAMNKQYLQQIVDEALRSQNRIMTADEADAFDRQYMAPWKKKPYWTFY